MNLRDKFERVLRSWNCYELSRKGLPIIDYDTHPERLNAEPASDRIEIHRLLVDIRNEAKASDQYDLAVRAGSEIAYLRAMLGERLPLSSYILATQGCSANGWSTDYIEGVEDVARARLKEAGVPWSSDTRRALEAYEGHVDADDVAHQIESEAAKFEPIVRGLTGASAKYTLDVMTVDEDAYWSYWLDTVGHAARLRINARNAKFTRVSVRKFALHEILGHALQSASYAAQAVEHDVPWIRYFTVHSPYQVMFEGVAQAMPLFAAQGDKDLQTRVSLDHYCQLVMSELHLQINAGVSFSECFNNARSRVPFWSDEEIGDLLAERSVNPQLRSYLWAYPAGIDWFVALASADDDVIRKVLHAIYRAPLSPTELCEKWPIGPSIGEGDKTFRLR